MSYSDLLKVYELWRAGDAAYGEGQHRAATELYRQATALADASDGVPAWYRGIMRRSFADELTALDRLREALAVLSEMPKTTEDGFRACCVYGSMTDHIDVALRMPARLAVIERACEQADRYFRAAGESGWQSRLLYFRAELLHARGLHAQALAVAQEGAARASEGCPKLFPSTHMWGLFRISLALGDRGEAGRYLARWVERYATEDKQNSVRGAYEFVMSSRLARADGDAATAVERARAGAHLLAAADWGDARFEVTCEQVRALTLDGQHHLAGQALARLAHARRSESGHRRYAYALLRGDYHLARARAAAGLPSMDDEFGTAGSRAGLNARPRAAGFEAARARRAYGEALKVGARMDSRLECTWRGEEVERRLARLAWVSSVSSRARAPV